jgi:hypothetical protein
MVDELGERGQALRRPPLPHSLALRLRDAGIAADVICQCVNVERAPSRAFIASPGPKLLAAQEAEEGRSCQRC